MRISVGVIFSLIVLWSGIFTFIFIVFRMVLLQDSRKHVIDLFDIEESPIPVQNSTQTSVTPMTSEVLTALQNSATQSSTSTAKFAYVTLLHGIDDTFSYRGYLYNCFIVKKALIDQGSTADFIVLVGFTYGENPHNDKITHDLALLTKFGIKLHYLPRLDDTAQTNSLSSPQNTKNSTITHSHKRKKVLFLEMALLKITPWSFTQYEKVQFFDGDVLPHKNMDCFFQLKVNTFNTGNASPLNSGWYVAVPNLADFAALKAKAIKRLHSKKWDERLGWGTPLPPDLKYRGGSKAVQKWAFNGASLDQGLLTDYFVLHQGRVQLLDSEHSPVPVQVYGEGYAHTGSTFKEALRCCGDAGLLPTQYFYHYTGKNKPWLQDLRKPKDASQRLWATYLDSLKIGVNASTIGQQKLGSPLGYFYPNK